MEPITTTLIGEIVAISAGLFIDRGRSDKRIEQAKQYLLSGIGDDLKHSIEISNTLKDEWENHSRVERKTINELKRCALTYRHNQELIALVYKHERGEQIFKYFHEIIEIIDAMEHDQGCINDVEAAFNDKLHSLRQRNPNISDEEAVTAVTSALNDEQKRFYSGLRKSMTASINRLSELTHTAAELIKALQ
jgi:hypothetical protein